MLIYILSCKVDECKPLAAGSFGFNASTACAMGEWELEGSAAVNPGGGMEAGAYTRPLLSSTCALFVGYVGYRLWIYGT